MAAMTDELSPENRALIERLHDRLVISANTADLLMAAWGQANALLDAARSEGVATTPASVVEGEPASAGKPSTPKDTPPPGQAEVREAYARIIDPEAFSDGYVFSDGSPVAHELRKEMARHKAHTKADRILALAAPPEGEVGELDAYDAGLLNDFGGGDVGWWQDYIRAELDRAHDFYAEQFAALAPSPKDRP